MNSTATIEAPVLITDSPRAFFGLLRAGIEQIHEAAKMLKRLVDKDPDMLTKLRDMEPTVAKSVYSQLLRVAEGHLLPQLLLNSAPAFKRMQTLPVTIQSALLKRGAVDLVINGESGEHLRVPLIEIETKHLPQLFDENGARDIDGQRAYLRRQARTSEEAAPLATSADFPWAVKGGRLQIQRPCELTKRELKRILSQMS